MVFSSYWYWVFILPSTIIPPFLLYFLSRSTITKEWELQSFINFALSLILWGWLGAVLTAKIHFILLHGFSVFQKSLNTEFLFTGQNWYGGLLFGLLYMLVDYSKKQNFKLKIYANLTIVLLLVVGIGKLGCFFAGHDIGCSGSISSLPWAIKLPSKEYLVHPRQIYDSLFYLLSFSLAIYFKDKYISVLTGFLIFIPIYGFISDFLSENLRIIGLLTFPQSIYLTELCIGAYLISRYYKTNASVS